MELKRANRYIILLVLSMAFNTMLASHCNTHKLLMGVNKNWKHLEITHEGEPQTEQELVQLHLMNVVAYLEKQHPSHLNPEQMNNRAKNIAYLRGYTNRGIFPLNQKYANRTPIFIDEEKTHCAVGYLLKINGFATVAKEIANMQLLAYLKDINHPQLIPWQKSSGLSLFELALIQPTYGPSTPICAKASPVQWKTLNSSGAYVQHLYTHQNSLYGIAQVNKYQLKHRLKKYFPKTQTWLDYGPILNGQILDLVFNQGAAYISVILPNEEWPFQILRLKNNQWKKVAHFNGAVQAIQAYKNQLFVLGKFNQVNGTAHSNVVVIKNNTIAPFKPVGLRTNSFDHMVASQSALFLTSRSVIYKYQMDTIQYAGSIQYFSYIKDISLDAQRDSLFVSSVSIGGYQRYSNKIFKTFHMQNSLASIGYPYGTSNFTKSKKVNGHMLIAGDFSTSTYLPRINDNSHLVKCADSLSYHWYGQGLLYEYGSMYYPILEEGIVLDFVQMGSKIYILLKDGSIRFANLNSIENDIIYFRKGLR